MGLLDYVVHRRPERLRTMKREILAGQAPRWILNNARARYIMSVVLSAPPWVDRDELKRLQARARCVSELSGVEHHIAHIVPLNHPNVCGLTVPWNLEIKPARANLAASNHFLPGQLSLF